MKMFVIACGMSLLLGACSAPKPPQPNGDWMPVNQATAKAETQK